MKVILTKKPYFYHYYLPYKVPICENFWNYEKNVIFWISVTYIYLLCTKNGKIYQGSRYFRKLRLCMVNNSDKSSFFLLKCFSYKLNSQFTMSAYEPKHHSTLGGIASICFRFHFHQTLRIHTQGCQGCQETRFFVRNSKILNARSTIQPKLSKIKNNLPFFKEFWWIS